MAYAQRTNYTQQNMAQDGRAQDSYARDEYRVDTQSGKFQDSSQQEDWNALRDELETLLEQVAERQHGEQRHVPAMQTHSPSYAPEAVSQQSDWQELPDWQETPDRRQQALVSVQRAVERFNEPDEASPMPAHSQNQLQSAIEQIRASQSAKPRQTRGRAAPVAPASNSNHLESLNTSLADINQRFAVFEQAIGGQKNSGQAIKDMAGQIEQLSSVVELLASSVGERKHIKRLESQIGKLANSMNSGPDLDFGAINQRLDVLSGAFEKLSTLQSQQVAHLIDSSDDHHMASIETGVRNIYDRLDAIDMEPIEACVRSVYDRMDTLESGMKVSTPAIERLSRDMADFTKAMRDEKGPVVSSSLATRVDALNQRIAQIEEGGEPVGDLKFDMQELHTAVLGAMEPRFAALENQIGALSGQVGKSASRDDGFSVDHLEEQIRALSDKMDRTGTDLNNLNQLYSEQSALENTPDFGAIADMVAQRTSEAMAKVQSGGGEPISQAALDELETRLSGLFEVRESTDNEQGFSDVQRSIDQVNQRLMRLENTLSARALDEAADDDAAAESSDNSSPNPMLASSNGFYEESDVDNAPNTSFRSSPTRPRHPGLADEDTDNILSDDSPDFGRRNLDDPAPTDHLIPALKDTMPRSPAEDAPLNAPAFPAPLIQDEPIPVPASLRVDPSDVMVMDNGESDFSDIADEQSETGNEGASGTKRIKLPQFNSSKMAPPPAPSSSFAPGAPDPETPSSETEASTGLPSPSQEEAKASETNDLSVGKDGTKVNRSTFIAAARRAAKMQNPESVDSGSQSLIGKALARFQKKQSSEKDETTTPEPERRPKTVAEPVKISKPAQPEPSSSEQMDIVEVPDSFLVRNRQPILLVATLLAVSMLTLNLINQRFNPADIGTGPSIAGLGVGIGSSEPETLPTSKTGDQKSEGGEFPTDNDVVGSINPLSPVGDVPVRMIDPALISDMPATLDLASVTAEQLTASPMTIELPPESLGPIGLRQTAANGDARAQFEVAAIYAEGRAIAQDLEAAAKWYERSAAQGFAPAAYRLGNMYENGIGVAKDFEQARLWYQLAANAGNRMSMHNLASLLASGSLGEQQFSSAAQWFEKAAALGLTDSQFNLGMLHARGLGVPQNLEDSFKWFSIAAAQGDEDAIRARDDVLRSLDAQTVTRLQNEIAGWSQIEMNLTANFAPIGTWSDSFDPGPTIDNRDIVMRVQAALNRLGFDTGTPDGLIGPKTVEAINGFERATGMSESGEVNPRLLTVLGSQPV